MRLFSAVLSAVLTMLVSSTAQAAVHSASTGDARDTKAYNQLDGSVRYDQWDIERVSVSYDDTVGSISITLRFYEPMPGSFIDQHDYRVSVAQDAESGCYGAGKGDFNLSLKTGEIQRPGLDPLLAPTSIPGMPETKLTMTWLSEYEGTIPYTTTVSSDLREFTLTASHKALAGRNYACVSAGEISDSWGSGCNEYRCWKGGSLDVDSHDSFSLRPRTPAAPAAPTAAEADDEPTVEPLPKLSLGEARKYVRSGLKQNFSNARRGAIAVSGCRSANKTRVHCRASWKRGDVSYRGPVSIWLTRDPDDAVAWNYAYTIRRTDRACQAAKRRNCVKSYRVK